MRSVLLVIEPIEESRQVNADNGDFLTAALADVCRSVTGTRLTPLVPRRLTAADVDDALALLDPADVTAVVFASNALRHPDGAMSPAYARHGAAVGRYLAGGGAVVVLHPYVLGDLGGHLGPYQPVLTARRPAPLLRLDPVTRYPHTVGTAIESHTAAGGQLREQVYWRALDMDRMPNFVPVLVTASGDTVAARARPDLAGSVIATTLPPDWHRARALTENVLHHALVPRARLAVWATRRHRPRRRRSGRSASDTEPCRSRCRATARSRSPPTRCRCTT